MINYCLVSGEDHLTFPDEIWRFLAGYVMIQRAISIVFFSGPGWHNRPEESPDSTNICFVLWKILDCLFLPDSSWNIGIFYRGWSGGQIPVRVDGETLFGRLGHVQQKELIDHLIASSVSIEYRSDRAIVWWKHRYNNSCNWLFRDWNRGIHRTWILAAPAYNVSRCL